MKKKAVIKLLTLCLCGTLTITGAATLARADAGTETGGPAASVTQNLIKEKNISSSEDGPAVAAMKDETIYVLANADGSSQKIIVSDWLKNPSGASSLKDLTTLADIENVKGDETYTQGQDGINWEACGNDVFYQGTSTKELPVSVKITYLLDDKIVTADELKGKSGHVTIRYEFDNHQSTAMEIGGRQETIYVPFTMLTGMILDGDAFHNVEVTGGRLVNDGDRCVVVGIAFPGLQRNLNLDAETFKIPDYLEIQADVTDFSLAPSVIVATNELFSKLSVDKFDSMGDLQDAMTKMTDAMSQLLDGSDQLSDGLNLLLEKSGELSGGVEKLASGALELQKGTQTLDNGAAQLATGTSKLSLGLDTIASNNDSLNGGARQVFYTLLTTARTQLTTAGLDVPEMTPENYGIILDGVIASLDENAVYATALQTVTNAVTEKKDAIQELVTAAVTAEVEKGVTAAVQAQVEEKVTNAVMQEITAKVESAIRQNVFAQVVLAATNMDLDVYNEAVAAGMIPEENQQTILATVDAKMSSEEIKAMTDAKVKEQMDSEAVRGLIAQNVKAQMASEEVQAIITSNLSAKLSEASIQQLIVQNTKAQIQKAITDAMTGEEVQGKLAAASEGAKSVISLKSSLDSYNTFYCGIQNYTAGVAQAAAGAGQLNAGMQSLKDGTAKLSTGAQQLNEGLTTLKESLPALVDGMTKLRDGSLELRNGLQRFDEEGIRKLADAVDGDLEGLYERLKATADASRSYRNFSGISENENGQVKFIYRIAGIEK
ncbi:MAG: hypothetical protein K6F51_15545 [Acetatifactor sp.]|nr:hypothetical protein [Acetatifactor sp.]